MLELPLKSHDLYLMLLAFILKIIVFNLCCNLLGVNIGRIYLVVTRNVLVHIQSLEKLIVVPGVDVAGHALRVGDSPSSVH